MKPVYEFKNAGTRPVIGIDTEHSVDQAYDENCAWCGAQLWQISRRGGKRRRFCSRAHRFLYWDALRRCGAELFGAGIISIDELRKGLAASVIASRLNGG